MRRRLNEFNSKNLRIDYQNNTVIYYNDGSDWDDNITKSDLLDWKRELGGNYTLITNSGIDLHTTEIKRNVWKGITIKKMSFMKVADMLNESRLSYRQNRNGRLHEKVSFDVYEDAFIGYLQAFLEYEHLSYDEDDEYHEWSYTDYGFTTQDIPKFAKKEAKKNFEIFFKLLQKEMPEQYAKYLRDGMSRSEGIAFYVEHQAMADGFFEDPDVGDLASDNWRKFTALNEIIRFNPETEEIE